MEDSAGAREFLSATMGIIQFLFCISILIWMRKRQRSSQKIPSLPKYLQGSRETFIPSFTITRFKAAQKKALSIARHQPLSVSHKISDNNEENNNIIVDDDASLDNLAQSIYRRPRNGPKKDTLVLEIYRKFLGLQAIHCSCWVLGCLIMFFSASTRFHWDISSEVKFLYYIGAGIIIAFGAGLLDTVQIFLVQNSVGETAIDRSSRFAFFWGLLNALICISLASIGRNMNPSIDKIRRSTRAVPWWNPFFVRPVIMLIFNLILMTNKWRSQKGNWCKKKSYSVAPEPIDLDTKKMITPEKKITQEKEQRSAWITLGIFNVISCSGLVILFICDYSTRTGGDFENPKMTIWATFVAGWIWVIFLCNTPILYLSLIKDSLYWSHLWHGELTALQSNANQLPVWDNVVIEYDAISYKLMLGRGGFSSVYKGTVWDTACAIKVLSFPELTKEVVERFLEEVRIFVKFRHPNLVRFVGACISPPQLCIVMELCNKLSMSGRLKKYSEEIWELLEKERQQRLHKINQRTSLWRGKGLSLGDEEGFENIANKKNANICNHEPSAYNTFSTTEKKLHESKSSTGGYVSKSLHKLFSITRAVEIALGIAEALQYMHTTHGVLHRDLKSSNILFDSQDRPKICDFGLSRELHKLNERNSFAGTIAYMSPEIIRMERATEKSDVYSFAILFWELLMSRLAWTKCTIIRTEEQWEKWDFSKPIPRPRSYNHSYIMGKVVVEDERPEITDDDDVHPVLHVLLRECWNRDIDLRPSFPDIVQRMRAFKSAQHFKRFESYSNVFGESKSTQWLTEP